jgi:opacity protein-like surface antigen
MKNIVLSAVAVFAMSSFAIAGGDIAPVEEPIVEVPEVVEVNTDAGIYLGLGYGALNIERTTTVAHTLTYTPDLDMDYDTLMFQAGYKFNSYVAVEYRYWKSLGDEDILGLDVQLGGNGTADISAYGIFVKPMYPVSPEFNVYALLGYGVATYEVNYGDLTGETDKDGFSWGLGASYAFTNNVSVSLDYTVIADAEYDDLVGYNGVVYDVVNDTTVGTVNVAVTYKF